MAGGNPLRRPALTVSLQIGQAEKNIQSYYKLILCSFQLNYLLLPRGFRMPLTFPFRKKAAEKQTLLTAAAGSVNVKIQIYTFMQLFCRIFD